MDFGEVLKVWIKTSTVVLVIVWLCIILHPATMILNVWNWKCIEQVPISDSIPVKNECVAYRKVK